MSWVFPFSVRETLFLQHDSFVGKKREKAWQATNLCLFGTIWKERNGKVFDNEGVLSKGVKFLPLVTFVVG